MQCANIWNFKGNLYMPMYYIVYYTYIIVGRILYVLHTCTVYAVPLLTALVIHIHSLKSKYTCLAYKMIPILYVKL